MLNSENKDVLQSATKAVKWATVAELVSKITTPILYLILAKILTPNDFGIISVAFALVNFCQLFWDLGLSKGLIQTDGSIEQKANSIFWVNVILSAGIYCFILIFAKNICNFLNIPNEFDVLRVLCFQIVLQAVSSTHQTLLTRSFKYRSIFIAKLSNSLIPIVIAIPLAILKLGVWSLVFGYLFGSLINAITLWLVSKWTPSFTLEFSALRNLFRFSFWTTTENFSTWFFSWGDNFLVGKFLGPYYLGIYTIGWTIVSMTFGLFITPIQSIAFSAFSRIKDNVSLVKSVYSRILTYTIFLSVPISVLFYTISNYLPDWLLNHDNGMILVIQLIGVLFGFSSLVSYNAELYRALGRPDINAIIMIIFIIIYLPVYLLIIPLGFEKFLWARLLLGMITIPIHVILLKKILQIDTLENLQKNIWIFLGGIEIIVLTMIGSLVFRYLKLNDLVMFVMLFISSIFVYLFTAVVSRPLFIKELLRDSGFVK